MIVECPNCHTRFNLPEDKANSQAKLKCSKCGNIFALEEGVSSEEDETGPDGDQLVQEFEAGEKNAGEESAPDDFNLDARTEAKKPGKKLVWTMFIILLLIAGFFAAYFYWPGFSGYVTGLAPEKGESSITSSKKAAESSIENIHLENVRQYFVRNEKIGQVFVIEGKAVNRFEKPRELIKLKAVLYDGQENVVQSKEFFCGNNVSLFQLQVSSREELESSLTARVGVITNNTYVKPGKAVPFMVAFYSPPDKVKEFGLEVIQAKEPSEDDS